MTHFYCYTSIPQIYFIFCRAHCTRVQMDPSSIPSQIKDDKADLSCVGSSGLSLTENKMRRAKSI